MSTKPNFNPGEVVIYQNGDSFELGVIKCVRIINDRICYFVWYHTGDTAACTHERNLHKIINSYAFKIERIKCD